MHVSQRPWRSNSFRFTGDSWLIASILQFTAQVSCDASPDWLHGLSLEAFGGPIWWDDGHPSARVCLATIPEEVAAACRGGACRLVLDMSNEGQAFMPEWLERLHDGLDALGIPADRCTLLQQNRAFEQPYRLWASGSGRTPLRIAIYDHFPRRLIGLASEDIASLEFNQTLRPKFFNCLNFTPRPPRVGMVSWLLAGGFDALGYLSFGTGRKDATIAAELEVYPWFPEIETVKRGLDMLRNRAPILLDLPAQPSSVPEYEFGPNFIYHNSYFSVVTESEISDGSLLRFTEKSLKPLLMLHPMIVIGNPGTLSLLRDMGFQTFPELFDEGYDLIEDPVARVRMVMQELARVLALPLTDVHDTFTSMRRKLFENSLWARAYLSRHYSGVLEPGLIDGMLK